MRTVRVAAHRGNSAAFPENTLPAFESALRLPIDNLEFDLHMTRDREIIVMHDHCLDRTTDGSGLIRAHTLAEIRRLDAGAWKDPRFAGTRVPTFREFLELVKAFPEMTFNVELKDYPRDGAEWAYESTRRIFSLMDEYGITPRSTINSWSGELLEYIDAEYDHRYRLHGYYPLELMGSKLTRDPYSYLYCICLFGTKEAPVAEKAAFDLAATRGVQPWVYYPDDSRDSFRLAIEYGAKLITTNDPAGTLDYLRGRGLHR